MIRNAFWLAVIAIAVAAIAGGVLGTVTAHPPPIVQIRQAPPPQNDVTTAEARSIVRGAFDERIQDAFAIDDVVVDRTRTQNEDWQRERLALVVGLCGNSLAAESGFLRLGYPVAFVVDPNAPQAAAFAKLVRAAGETLFVQVSAAPAQGKLAALHRLLGDFDGVASRDASGMAAALTGSGLTFFDERGDSANPPAFGSARVPLVVRDVTVDDRTARGYVVFMLERASALSRRVGPVVVLLRPLPSTLAALQAFTSSHDVEMVALR